MAQKHTWVDAQIREAMARGDFDDLPGAGKPLQLGDSHDPDWWLKKLVERENIAVLPPSLALRKEDAELDDTLDTVQTEALLRADQLREHGAAENGIGLLEEARVREFFQPACGIPQPSGRRRGFGQTRVGIEHQHVGFHRFRRQTGQHHRLQTPFMRNRRDLGGAGQVVCEHDEGLDGHVVLN